VALAVAESQLSRAATLKKKRGGPGVEGKNKLGRKELDLLGPPATKEGGEQGLASQGCNGL